MNLTYEFSFQMLAALASGVGIYTAIRADLATLHEKVNNAAKAAEQAHRRIDEHMAKATS